jgi:hypothetical protein
MEARAEALVEQQWAPIKRLANALTARETMTGPDILAVLNADLPPIEPRKIGGFVIALSPVCELRGDHIAGNRPRRHSQPT